MKMQLIWAEENKEVFYDKDGMWSWTGWGVEFKNIFYSPKVYGVINVHDALCRRRKNLLPLKPEVCGGRWVFLSHPFFQFPSRNTSPPPVPWDTFSEMPCWSGVSIASMFPSSLIIHSFIHLLCKKYLIGISHVPGIVLISPVDTVLKTNSS